MKSNDAERKQHRRFEDIVGIYYQDMYRSAAWLCRDKAIAEDVVREAPLRAWKSLDTRRA